MNGGITCRVHGCGTALTDRTVCADCLEFYRSKLVGGHGHASVGQLVSQLEHTLARQGRVGGAETGIRTKTDAPLAFHQGASDALRHLCDALRDALRTLSTKPLPGAGDNLGVGAEARGFALVLVAPAWLHAVELHTDGPRIINDIVSAIGRGWATIDRPPDTQYAGPCDECRTDMYAQASARAVECPHCKLEYDLGARRTWLLARVEDRLLTAVEASRALPGLLERDLSVDTIRAWIHRNRVVVRGYLHGDVIVPQKHDKADRPVVRAGDLIDLALQQRKADDGKRRAKAS